MQIVLRRGQTLFAADGGHQCTVQESIGSGGQGAVYSITLEGGEAALKWYHAEYLIQDPGLRARLQTLIGYGAPSSKFLWPEALAEAKGVAGFGYIMPLRHRRYRSIVDLMTRRIEPSFRTIITAGLQLADAFHQLHAKGLCYCDISFGNVFFDPLTGDVSVCDNDNVTVNGTRGAVAGTPLFMAPEILVGRAAPSTQTDLYSLAVLLFYLLMVHHPLQGRKVDSVQVLDAAAMVRMYGSEALFIFDPNDPSNTPLAGYHENAIAYWPIYPDFLRRAFTKAFTDGLRDAKHGRVVETEWRRIMARLLDSIVYCQQCRRESFHDAESARLTEAAGMTCWLCGTVIEQPPHIRIGDSIVMLNHDSRLYPHHIDASRPYDFTRPVAEVRQHPRDPQRWGLANLSGTRWIATMPSGQSIDVDPDRSIGLASGTRINFGRAQGEIRA